MDKGLTPGTLTIEQGLTPGTLTVVGEGQVQVRPDLATIQLGVVTTAATAAEALTANAERMRQVVDRMKALGISDEDLQTVGLSIWPLTDTSESSPTPGAIVGYRVENTVSVRVGVERAGEVLDEGVAAGANVGGQLTFGVRDEGPHRQRALEAAVQAAQRDAEVLARVMGVRLAGIHSAEVVYGGAPIILRGAMAREAMVPIEPGLLSISASVRIAYRL